MNPSTINPIHVEIYLTPRGRSPYIEWVRGLKDIQARATIHARIARLRLGNFGNHKIVGDGIWELRIDIGPGYRIYYGKKGNTLVILLLGGTKRTQANDIKKAKTYWKDFEARSRFHDQAL